MTYKTLNEACTFQWFYRVKTDFNLLDVLQMSNVTAINTWIKWTHYIHTIWYDIDREIGEGELWAMSALWALRCTLHTLSDIKPEKKCKTAKNTPKSTNHNNETK